MVISRTGSTRTRGEATEPVRSYSSSSPRHSDLGAAITSVVSILERFRLPERAAVVVAASGRRRRWHSPRQERTSSSRPVRPRSLTKREMRSRRQDDEQFRCPPTCPILRTISSRLPGCGRLGRPLIDLGAVSFPDGGPSGVAMSGLASSKFSDGVSYCHDWVATRGSAQLAGPHEGQGRFAIS
jgi:hypothetical protein